MSTSEIKQEAWVKTYCGGKPNYTTPVHGSDIPQERIDETEKDRHDPLKEKTHDL
jgi:hypothetical protein